MDAIKQWYQKASVKLKDVFHVHSQEQYELMRPLRAKLAERQPQVLPCGFLEPFTEPQVRFLQSPYRPQLGRRASSYGSALLCCWRRMAASQAGNDRLDGVPVVLCGDEPGTLAHMPQWIPALSEVRRNLWSNLVRTGIAAQATAAASGGDVLHGLSSRLTTIEWQLVRCLDLWLTRSRQSPWLSSQQPPISSSSLHLEPRMDLTHPSWVRACRVEETGARRLPVRWRTSGDRSETSTRMLERAWLSYKVKSHASMRDAANEPTTWTDRAGKNAADEAAKAALCSSCLKRGRHAFRARGQSAQRSARYTGEEASSSAAEQQIPTQPSAGCAGGYWTSSSQVGRSCRSLAQCLVLRSLPFLRWCWSGWCAGSLPSWRSYRIPRWVVCSGQLSLQSTLLPVAGGVEAGSDAHGAEGSRLDALAGGRLLARATSHASCGRSTFSSFTSDPSTLDQALVH